MNDPITVQYALLCLRELGDSKANSISPTDISRRCGIPRRICQNLLDRFCDAGLLAMTEDCRFYLTRPLEELTSLEVLQAVWTDKKKTTPFRLLYQGHKGGISKTLEAVAFGKNVGAFPGEGGSK